MAETILSTSDNVKFIEGMTKMNQSNWQTYFGKALPNGVYDGLLVQDFIGSSSSSSDTYTFPRMLTAGSVFVNGIMAKLDTNVDLGEITGQTGVYDRFICARVWLHEEKMQIIQKTGIAEYSSDGSMWNYNLTAQTKFFMDYEDYQCTRNTYYYDVPLFYQSYGQEGQENALSKGRNLRRMVNLNQTVQSCINPMQDGDVKVRTDPNHIGIKTSEQYVVLLYGKNSCCYPYRYSSSNPVVFMDTIDHPDGAMIYMNNDGSSSKSIHLSLHPWINRYADTPTAGGFATQYQVKYVFSNPSEWYDDSTYKSKRISVPANTAKTVKVTLIDKTEKDLVPTYPHAFLDYTYYVEAL